MRLWLGLLAGGMLALTAAVSTATGGGTPIPNVMKLRLSGYGVYHRTFAEEWQVPACVPNQQGSGLAGERRDLTTIKWSTDAPGNGLVEIIDGHPQQMVVGVNVYLKPGILATGTVTHVVTGDVESVVCHSDGTETRTHVDTPNECGTHTYKKGYTVLPMWWHIPGVAGQNIAAAVESNIVSEVHFRKDWNDCWAGNINAYTALNVIHGKLPFDDLPAEIRGKVSVIAHGQKVVTDTTIHESHGYSVHQHDAFSGTNYLTLIRIPVKSP